MESQDCFIGTNIVWPLFLSVIKALFYDFVNGDFNLTWRVNFAAIGCTASNLPSSARLPQIFQVEGCKAY